VAGPPTAPWTQILPLLLPSLKLKLTSRSVDSRSFQYHSTLNSKDQKDAQNSCSFLESRSETEKLCYLELRHASAKVERCAWQSTLQSEATCKSSVSHSAGYSGLCPCSAQPGKSCFVSYLPSSCPWANLIHQTEVSIMKPYFSWKIIKKESPSKVKRQNDIC